MLFSCEVKEMALLATCERELTSSPDENGLDKNALLQSIKELSLQPSGSMVKTSEGR